MCSCCGEEQPSEVKLASAKVLVSCTGSVLSSPQLPLGECRGRPCRQKWRRGLVLKAPSPCVTGLPATLSLWRSLFTLLQDEDQDVRAAAADFVSAPASPLSAGTHRPPGRTLFSEGHSAAFVLFCLDWRSGLSGQPLDHSLGSYIASTPA